LDRSFIPFVGRGLVASGSIAWRIKSAALATVIMGIFQPAVDHEFKIDRRFTQATECATIP
jgi:hypothetical protein